MSEVASIASPPLADAKIVTRFEITSLGRSALDTAILAEQLAAEARIVDEAERALATASFAGATLVEPGLVPGCPHTDASLVDSHSNYPTDTITLRYRCWACCASWEREYLPTDPEVNDPDVARMLCAEIGRAH